MTMAHTAISPVFSLLILLLRIIGSSSAWTLVVGSSAYYCTRRRSGMPHDGNFDQSEISTRVRRRRWIASHLAAASASEAENDNDTPFIPILLETKRFLVVDKPPGIPHHNDSDQLGLLNLVRAQLLSRSAGGAERGDAAAAPPPPRLWGVHRLDRVTSGIVVLAKDAEAAGACSRAFANGNVVKYYTGLSRHKPTKKKQGWVRGSMVRGRRKSWYLTTTKPKTNFAQTRFFTAGLGQLLENNGTSGSSNNDDIKTLILFRPYTGKTHQLRVAAKSVGLPLAGDPIYSHNNKNNADGHNNHNGTMSRSRTYLHATGLHIPASAAGNDGEALTVWCPPLPFESCWSSEGSRADFWQVWANLVRRHCDCPELLGCME